MHMMIAAVGRSRSGPERSLFDQYAVRIRPSLLVKEVEGKRSLPCPDRVKHEGERLLSCVPPRTLVVALDERGDTLSSHDFAALLQTWQRESVASCAFLIGGADGHSDAVRQRADILLALGPMTWPHMLVRSMLAEQIYRAQCIAAQHPYHRG